MLHSRVHDLLQRHAATISYEDVDRETRALFREHWSWLELLQKLRAMKALPIVNLGQGLAGWNYYGPVNWHETRTHKFVLLCPFHLEKTPSLRGWPEGWFYCHGCQTQGDYFDFALAYLERSVPAALQLLGNCAEPDPNQDTLFVPNLALQS